MKKKAKQNSKLTAQLRSVKKQLTGRRVNEKALNLVATKLNQIGDQARDESSDALQRGAELLARVSELAASWSSEGNEDSSLSMVEFLGQNVGLLQDAAAGNDRTTEIDEFIELANENWDEYLSLFDSDAFNDDRFEQDDFTDAAGEWNEAELDASVAEPEEDESDASGDQIQLMLAALQSASSTAVGTDEQQVDPPTNDSLPATVSPSSPAAVRSQSDNADLASLESAAKPLVGTPPQRKKFDPQADSDDAARKELAADRELLEAYLDDALRCLSSMEQAAMTIEESPEDHETGRQFCRELHTLKGASGTVGLRGLATELHDLESSLETMFADENSELDADPLFAAVDRVREVITSLQDGDDASAESPPAAEVASEVRAEAPEDSKEDPLPQVSAPIRNTPRSISDFGGASNNEDASIRIRASKLDRLMDMLAELVVLRNRRESHVNEFNELNGELIRCSARVSFADEQWDQHTEFANDHATGPRAESNMSEVAKDIAAVSHGLRDLQKPVIQDNVAISRFIRDFRQELMQLRRVPVSGLFSRLQRAARDAAKAEQKKVRVVVEGEHAGLEQEIQERLFDSLLHVVRNSVSHGVETPEQRRKAGKNEVGTITLEATSNAQLLMLEVRDDGGGINYEAVRRRGVERGLIRADQRSTNDQLARLIFQPGFSTRDQASEISGRGVGMDVVATTIEQMHGRIEIESTPGSGTTMRLLIPLRTGIEHVMVFRSGGQLFALPMQSITAVKSAKLAAREGVETISLSTALSIYSDEATAEQGEVLLLRRSSRGKQTSSGNPLAVAIDQMVGPEEVVVRGLPNLLRVHPLMNGITLSGSGEKVLLLDADRLVDFCVNHELDLRVDETANEQSEDVGHQKRVLVVDDSLTARKVLSKILRQLGLAVVEAGDGIEAISQLRRQSFDLVLTDLDMPRMGGLELLSDIESGGYCEAPRVIVSSRNENKFRDQATEAGACEFLNKPVNQSIVTQLLENLELLPTT